MAGRRTSRLERLADKYIGETLVRLLSFFTFKRTMPVDIKRICFVKTAAIGDTVISSAVVYAARERYPNAHIAYVAGRQNIDAAKLMTCVDEFIEISHKKPLKSFLTVRKLEYFDVVIDLGAWPRFDALLTYFIKSGCRIGFQRKGFKRHFLYNEVVEHRGDIHEVENYKNLVDVIGAKLLCCPKLDVGFSRGDKLIKRRIVMHSFVSGLNPNFKKWPHENWVKFAQMLAEQGFEVVFTSDATDTENAEKLAKDTGHDRVYSASFEKLQDTAELLLTSAAAVSVNTGIMHLAAALECPVVGLSGPTSVIRWGALGDNSVNIQSDKPCAPCLDLGFEYGCDIGDCMVHITPEQVFDSLLDLLGEGNEAV